MKHYGAVCRFLENSKKSGLDLHAFQAYRKGELLFRVALPPYTCEQKRQQYSLSKSFTSLAIGFAVQEKRLSIEDSVISFFPDKLPQKIEKNLAAMQVRHLLSMNTGHSFDTTGFMVKESSDWVKKFLSFPVEYAPGTHFLYNTGATYMLSAILSAVTGQTLFDYLTPRLFDPLNIENAFWNTCSMGNTEGGYGLHISCDDIMKFGIFCLNRGSLNGQQLLNREWFAKAAVKQSDNSGVGASPDWRAGYGFQFWINDRFGWRADGSNGQICLIDPERELVFVVVADTDDMQNEMDLITECIENLENTDGTEEELNRMIRDYHPAQSSLRAVNRKVYRCEDNCFGFTWVSVETDIKNELIFRFSDGKRVQSVRCGNGKWIENKIRAVNLKPKLDLIHIFMEESLHFAASYKEEDGRIRMQWRYLDCPHVQEIVLEKKEIQFLCRGNLMLSDRIKFQ